MQYAFEEIRELLNESGGSAYIVDLYLFRQNVDRFQEAFRAIYPNTRLGYSYKTNYLPELCVSADQMGLYAEVVSGSEYELAHCQGVAGDRIIFNGPVKTERELEVALQAGAIVNIDSLEEASRVGSICEADPDRNYSVGLRCSISCDGNSPSRFGLPVEDGQLDAAFRQLDNLANCTVAGLHCHSSSERSAESFRKRCQTMLDLAERLFPDMPPRYLDLGGGFCGPMPASLREQFGEVPSFQSYAEQIAPLFAQRYGVQGETRLILEPGVGILANVMRYACEVVSIKKLPRRQVAVTTGSYQEIKPSINRVNLPIEVLPASRDGDTRSVGEADLVGYTCIEDDVLYHDYKGPLGVGDLVVFENAGAYSMVFKPPFMRGRPPCVSRDHERGCWNVLHARQPLTDWLG